jgi:hypothetical protein
VSVAVFVPIRFPLGQCGVSPLFADRATTTCGDAPIGIGLLQLGNHRVAAGYPSQIDYQQFGEP